ncbi:MAG TPA: BON domain-containing protein [Burkholderiaceae bacterium]|nr:BON domain-containing protein [Burkholderiaceae bacterium]
MRVTVSLFRSVLMVVASCTALCSCIVAFGGAALGTALVATDRRSMGIQLEDAQIEHRINTALDEHFTRESVYIDVTSYNQKVLLAGQVPQEKDRGDAEAIAASSEGVRQVVNELTIGSMSGLASRTEDTATAGKVRSALLQAPGLPNGAVKVTCTDGAIYLFGRVGSAEAEIAQRTASHVGGVKRVVALFDLLTDAELAQLQRETQTTPAPPVLPAAEAH